MRGHFNKPGASAHESLNNLAAGFERSEAARLFYETCGRIPHLVLNFSSMGSNDGCLLKIPLSLPIIFGQLDADSASELPRSHCT